MSNTNTEMVMAPYSVSLTAPDANGNRMAVREEDPRGKILLVAKGAYIHKDEVERYGLFQDPELNLSLDEIAEQERAAIFEDAPKSDTESDSPETPPVAEPSSETPPNRPPISGVAAEPPPVPEVHPDDQALKDATPGEGDELGD